jgi:hypothetical protein
MPWPPPVVMLTTASLACLMRGRKAMKTLRDRGRPAVLRVARMQVDDGGAGLGRADRLLGDLLRGDRQMR